MQHLKIDSAEFARLLALGLLWMPCYTMWVLKLLEQIPAWAASSF